ncbi:MAG TPA: aspartate aminotransferase family protein [Vicinamibacteria bacterium]|nr:aspartate aminotransferase family protein [Vicinamibacteria bacterium]
MSEQASSGTTLDSGLDRFRADLLMAAEIVIRLYEGLDRARVTPASSRSSIASLFEEPLPEEPASMETILRAVETDVIANSTLSLTPRFFGYINGCGNQAAILGSLIAAAMNQVCAKWEFSPSASEMERQVIRWIAELLGYAPRAGGCLLSGGSAGNFVALAVARTRKATFDAASLGMKPGAPLTAFVSQEGHASLDKSMALLGMGRNQLRRIAVAEDFTIDLEALLRRVQEDRKGGFHPFCVVGNAGTTNTGAVDPLEALADFCREQGLWFHVDASYGGPAAATEAAGRLFRGMERADSLVVNPHKWMYLPVEAACILVREPRALPETFRITADYLRDERDESDASLDFKDCGPQLSRGFRALNVWMTLRAYGARKLRDAIESNIEIMRYLAERIDQSRDFVRLAPVPLSVVCFQYRTPETAAHSDSDYLDRLNDLLADALRDDGRVFVSKTRVAGRTALRACSVNHRLRRKDVDFLLEVIRDVARSLSAPRVRGNERRPQRTGPE